jgi:hypothetical protein
LAQALLHDRRLAPVVAVAGLSVAAAIFNDLIFGALGVTKEVGLIGRASIASALLGLLIFASGAWWWGLDGALWACLMVYAAGLALSILLVRWRSSGLRWRDVQGRFDPAIARQVLGFFPMLVVNGVMPALTLILVRDQLAGQLSLEAAGLWQASWRLSEACQALVVASVALRRPRSRSARRKQFAGSSVLPAGNGTAGLTPSTSRPTYIEGEQRGVYAYAQHAFRARTEEINHIRRGRSQREPFHRLGND